jgi:hypothetical protein
MTLARPFVAPGLWPVESPPSDAALSLARSLIAVLFALIVAMMFTLSGSILWDLGLNYAGVEGAAASKIHPATYLSLATLGCLIFARRNPASFFVHLVARRPGALVFLIAICLFAFIIVIDHRKGIATVFDTYLLAVMLSLIAADLDGRGLARVEKIVHFLLAANALLALVEYLSDQRIFPYRFEGIVFDWDRRSTALLGHPLENAQITGTYIMILVAGGGSNMPKLLRLPAILLQLAALVPFGGRTALLVTVAMLAIWIVPQLLRFLGGGRVSVPAAAAVALLAPMLALALGLFATGGFFKVVSDRFASDGGSAYTRLEMFEIFEYLAWRDILIGTSADLVDSIRRTHGLEWGIENPVVRLVLYQGAAITSFLVTGFILFLAEINRRLQRGTALPFIFFVIVINSYESISNKSVMLGQFVVLMMVMFRPQIGSRPSFPAPGPPPWSEEVFMPAFEPAARRLERQP